MLGMVIFSCKNTLHNILNSKDGISANECRKDKSNFFHSFLKKARNCTE